MASGGIWWVLLGWFIISVASAEEQQARVSMALAGVRVRDVMSSPVETADGRRSVEEFVQKVVLDRPHSTFPLTDDSGRFNGLVTLRQLRSVPARERRSTSVAALAVPPERVPAAEPDEPLATVLPRLSADTGGRIVVLRADELVGIVSPSDISRAVARHGLHVGTPGGADLRWSEEEPTPPPGWWFPGQREDA